jgi:ABC-type nitrate/sulfonate/bicarbonate transport system substrate-binding protein
MVSSTSLNKRRTTVSAYLLAALTLAASVTWAQPKLRINWVAVSGTMSGIWVAYEEGLFKKSGLDVELVHVASSSRAIQTMLAGEIAFSTFDVTNLVQANLKGAELVLLAGITNRLMFSVMSRPDIKKLADLKGKTVGITRIGSATQTVALFALGEAGLKPGDYTLLPLTEVPSILAALTAGQIDAGILSPPTNSRARKSGFNELKNLAVDGPDYPSIAFGSSRAYVKANEDVTRRVVRAYLEGVHLFKTNKALGIKTLQKYTKVQDPQVLEDTYAEFREHLESSGQISRKGLETILAEMAANEPKAKQAKPEDFFDERFLNR